MLTAAASMWTSKDAAFMPRGSINMSTLSIFGQQDVCLREEGRIECEVLTGEGILRLRLRKVSNHTIVAA